MAVSRIMILAAVVWADIFRRKDVYVLAVLLLSALVGVMSFRVFNLGGLVSHVKELGLLGAWLLAWILTVTASVRQMPQEEARGTVFSMLARPVTRFEFIFAKWLGVWSVVSVVTALSYALVWLIVALRGGSFGVVVLCQGLLLHIAFLAVVAAAGILFSTRLNADAAGTLTTFASLVSFALLPRVPDLIAYSIGWRQTGLLVFYHAMPNLSFFDMRQRLVHGWAPAPSLAVAAALAYAALEVFIILFAAWLLYRRKSFSRAALQ